MKEQKMPVNKLEKISSGRYRLTTEFERLVRVDEFDKAFLKESYESGVAEYNRVLEQLRSVNKKLDSNPVTPDDVEEVERFIALNNKAAAYSEHKKLLDQRDAALDMLERLRAQKEDIEKVVPELKRAKKK